MLDIWKEKIFSLGKTLGFKDMEVYWEDGQSFVSTVFEGELNRHSLSTQSGLAFRGLYNDRMGYAYTEELTDEAVKRMVHEAVENAKILEVSQKEYIYAGQDHVKALDLYNADYEAIDNKKKIDFLMEVEKHAKALDPRVFKVSYNLFGDSKSHLYIENTNGMVRKEKQNSAYAYVSVVVKDDKEQKTGAYFVYGNEFEKFDSKCIAEAAVKEALSQLGGKPVLSDNYPVVFRNKESAQMLQVFASNFSAENVQKDLSNLKGKMNEAVASEIVQVVDNPHLENALASRSFDSEGVATSRRVVIENGILKTYLHSLKTAYADDVAPTGHGMKASFKSSVGIAPSNMYIGESDKLFDELIADIETGIYITGLQGLHSGANGISGDFSLQANGFIIENGKIGRPVSQITVSGNYFELLKNVEMIGNDLTFILPSGASVFGSPSIKIKSLTVSGE